MVGVSKLCLVSVDMTPSNPGALVLFKLMHRLLMIGAKMLIRTILLVVISGGEFVFDMSDYIYIYSGDV